MFFLKKVELYNLSLLNQKTCGLNVVMHVTRFPYIKPLAF